MSVLAMGYNVGVRRILVLGVALLAIAAGSAHGGGPSAPLPLPCGLPPAQPLWVDYADGGVPFWSTIFARPGVVAAASNLLIPPQLRAKGAQTVYFDLHLVNRVGTPSKPTDPATIPARADRLFDAAVASSGCDHPLIAENELFGAQLPTPWTPTTAQYRANVLAFLQRLSERGARPFLLLSSTPYTHDATVDAWWQQAAQVADLVPEIYFSGPSVARQGAVAGSRRLRATMRNRVEQLIEIGVPTNRLGMMLTFSSTPHAGGREGLTPLSKWLDVVKWEGLAAKQVASELALASVWSWGWAAFNPAGNDPDKPKAACTWLWTRDHSLCDAPSLAGPALDTSLDVGATLPTGTICLLDKTKLLANDVAALSRLTGDRDLAYSAAFQHAVLADAQRVVAGAVANAERGVILDHFGGSRTAYLVALERGRGTPTLARTIIADELRRGAVERALRVARPTAVELRQWYETYASANARLVHAAQPERWLGNERSGVAVSGQAPGRLFGLAAGRSAVIAGVQVTVDGEVVPLGSFSLAQAAPAVRAALVAQQKDAAFVVWLRRRQNQSLARLTCQHDQPPQAAIVDLTDWLPYLSLG